MSQNAGRTRGKSLYSVHPAFAYQEAVLANLRRRTRRTPEEWIRLVRKSRPPTQKARTAWLKTHRKLGGGTAMLVAERAEGKGGREEYNPEALVEAMFAGPKHALRPIYDELLKLGLNLGKDAKACPCKTIVPLYRKHVFAEIKPVMQTRIDLGLALKSTEATGRRVDTGGLAKGDRITHRILIMSVAEIDDEVKHWLQTAYDLDA